MQVKVEIAKAFEQLFQPHRYKVFYGGRGGAKSWAFAQALLLLGSQDKKLILCTREFQGSIQDSVHRLLSDQIDRMGLSAFYEIQQTVIRGLNGTEFIFEGLKNNVTKIKSMEGVDIVWCEEAESIRESSWDILIPTIRKTNSEIWVSFNPADEMDATYQKFVLNPPKSAFVKKVGWRDNPWFPFELRQEMEEMRENQYKKYLHIWEGECNAEYTDSIIEPEWVEAAIGAHKKLGFDPVGVKVAGFDPADESKTGNGDAKAVAIRHGSVVTDCVQWHEGDIDDAINKAFNIAFDEQCDYLEYDAHGLGAAVKVGLDKRTEGKHLKVEAFFAGEGVTNPTHLYDERTNKQTFKNKRAQWYWYLRDRLFRTYLAVEKDQYHDPDELISFADTIEDMADLRSELCKIRRKTGTSNSLIQLESKADMRKRGVNSPNMADALVICFANTPPSAKIMAKTYTIPNTVGAFNNG